MNAVIHVNRMGIIKLSWYTCVTTIHAGKWIPKQDYWLFPLSRRHPWYAATRRQRPSKRETLYNPCPMQSIPSRRHPWILASCRNALDMLWKGHGGPFGMLRRFNVHEGGRSFNESGVVLFPVSGGGESKHFFNVGRNGVKVRFGGNFSGTVQIVGKLIKGR